MFGPPNDEAFQGHPLASRGLGVDFANPLVDGTLSQNLSRGRKQELALYFNFHINKIPSGHLGVDVDA
jgi:hypothetical protein